MSDFNQDQAEQQATATDEPSFAEAQLVGGAEPVKKKPVFLIILIIIAVLAACGAAAYNFIPWVKNNVKMLISSPEKYYLWVEEENLQQTADKISGTYGDIIDAADLTSKQSEVEIKADIDSANVGALIEQLTGEQLSSSGIVLPESISVKAGANMTDNGVSSSMLINAADKTLATLNTYIQENAVYIQIPELSPAYISMDMSTIEDAWAEELGDEASGFLKGYMDAVLSGNVDASKIEDTISEKELNDFIVRYFTIIFENVDDVEIEKGVSTEVGGIKTKYNKLSADINQGTLFKAVKDILKEAKKDDLIIGIAEDMGYDKDTYTAAIDAILDQFGSLSVSGGESLFTMNVYVDSKGKICGRDIEIPDETVNIGYMSAKDGADSVFDLKITDDTNEGLQIICNSEENSEKESGEIKFVGIGMNDDGSNIEFAVKYEDIEVVDEAKGYCKGNISLDLSAFDAPVITINLDSDGKSQTISSDITVDGTKYGTISIIEREEVTVETPAFDSAQQVFAMSSDGTGIDAYIESVGTENLASFVDNIGSAFGVDGLGQILMLGMNSDPSGDIYNDPNPTGGTTGGDITSSNVNTQTENATYDFSKIAIKINDQAITLPAKINGILDMVKVDEDSLEPDYSATFFNDDNSLSVTMTNNGNSKAAPADCAVTGLEVSEGSPISLSFDGITIGSNISDVVSKYGVTLTDPSSGYVSVYDTASEWNDITFFYYDGKIYSIGIDIL